MPQDAPATKRAATQGYGAEVVLYDPRHASRDELARSLQEERGRGFLVPPYDHPDIIAGQGTATLELYDQAGAAGYAAGPLRRGAGCSADRPWPACGVMPGCRVIGIEPETGR